jgi:hypothetical protein
MYSQLEDWYDQHPEASFGEIEAEARRLRRALIGPALATLINGRDLGYQLTPPPCPQCERPMEFERYRSWQVHGLEGDTDLSHAYYVCQQLDGLWEGGLGQVFANLESLGLNEEGYPAEVRQAPGYFRSNQERMRYDQFRAEGYPIGSGTVESAANTVVHHRLRRPGRGRQRDLAQAMLAGLSELYSGRFEVRWPALLQLAA